MKTSRRNFMKLAGASVVAASALSACTAKPAAPASNIYSGPLPEKWDLEEELVIVGAGGTGLCAGIEAVRAGLKPLLIEKASFLGGVSSGASGYFYGGSTIMQEQQGIKDSSVDIWWSKLEDGTGWSEPLNRVRDNRMLSPVYYGIVKRNQQLFRDITYTYKDLIALMLEYGVQFYPIVQTSPFTHSAIRGELPKFFKALAVDIRKGGGRFLTNTRGNKIYLTPEGVVAGLRAEQTDGTVLNIKTKAVLLSSGGFLDSDQLIQRYMPFWANQGKVPAAFLFSTGGHFGTQTGDGIVMGLEVNASVDDMAAGFKYKIAPKNRGEAVVNGIAMIMAPMIFVTQQGKRVIDERENYSSATLALIHAGAKESYFVFDEKTMNTDAATRFDFHKLVASGSILKANTLEEASRLAGVDAAGLMETVKKFNEDFDKTGVDSVFGKTGHLYQKIDTAPFYISAPHYPVRFKTEGGLETDERTRVVDHRTVQPIKGLYAAGATNGTCTASLGDIMQCGRLSAKYIKEDIDSKFI